MRPKALWGWASLSALVAVSGCLALPARAGATYPGRSGQLGGLAWTADGFSMFAREYPDGLLPQFHRVARSWVRYPMYSPRGKRLVDEAFSVLGEGSVHVSAWSGGGERPALPAHDHAHLPGVLRRAAADLAIASGDEDGEAARHRLVHGAPRTVTRVFTCHRPR
jgi:hypothetical protein